MLVNRAPHTAFAEVMHLSCKGEISPYFGDGIDLLFYAVYLLVTLHLFSVSYKKKNQKQKHNTTPKPTKREMSSLAQIKMYLLTRLG